MPAPSPPPSGLAKAFSRPGLRRILPWFSRVMRGGLLIVPGVRKSVSGHSGRVFSRPDDCVELVNLLNSSEDRSLSGWQA